MEEPIPASVFHSFRKHKYHIVGSHSAVKRCKWLYEALIHDRPCYKQKFYGIKTHQCIQMTPALFYCTQRCLFCWRAQSGDLDSQWNETKLPSLDPPDAIVQKSLAAQLKILSGYKGNSRTDRKKLKEALTPGHAAISLTGEPTLYKPLGELIQAFHRKGLTTFLVSNGTVPSVLSSLGEEPTQLYISLCAPDRKTYNRVCRPQIRKAWKKINESLELLPSFKCPKVIRITSVRRLNMIEPEKYARLIEKAEATYVEPKAYMHVGYSRLRLEYDNMPTHREIIGFARQLADETGYQIVDESQASRVVLLSKNGRVLRFSEDLP